jgi:hypothetical protein
MGVGRVEPRFIEVRLTGSAFLAARDDPSRAVRDGVFTALRAIAEGRDRR